MKSQEFDLDDPFSNKSLTPDATDDCHQRLPSHQSRVGNIERSYSCDIDKEISLKQFSQSSSDISSDHGGSRTKSASSDSDVHKKRVWRTVMGATTEVSIETRRFLSFIKRKLHSKHGKKETAVKEIHIAPEFGENSWARKSAIAGCSDNLQVYTTTTNYSKSRDSTDLFIVHDMNN